MILFIIFGAGVGFLCQPSLWGAVAGGTIATGVTILLSFFVAAAQVKGAKP